MKMTFDQFVSNHILVSAWFTSVGSPTGVEITVNTEDGVADEDYCDEQMLLDAIPYEEDLVGTTTTDENGLVRWGVDSLQDSGLIDYRGNTVLNMVLFGRKPE